MCAQFFFACSHSDTTMSDGEEVSEEETVKPVFPERVFSSFPDFCNTFHSLDCSLDQFTVVSNGYVSSFLKVYCRILGIMGE
jgi:hypothetical protein